jgi:hypothetical protein
MSSELEQEVVTLREYGTVVTKENERLWDEVCSLQHTVADLIAERDSARTEPCRAALANIMARIDADEFIPTEFKEDARKALGEAS